MNPDFVLLMIGSVLFISFVFLGTWDGKSNEPAMPGYLFVGLGLLAIAAILNNLYRNPAQMPEHSMVLTLFILSILANIALIAKKIYLAIKAKNLKKGGKDEEMDS